DCRESSSAAVAARMAAELNRKLRVKLTMDLDLDLPLPGEEHAVGPGVEGGLRKKHQAATGSGVLKGEDVRLTGGQEARIEATGEHPPEVGEVGDVRPLDQDFAIDQEVAGHRVGRLELLARVHRRPPHAGRVLERELLCVLRVALPGAERDRLDDALERRVLADDRLHGAKDR